MYMDIWQFQVHDIGSGFTKSIGEITTQTLRGYGPGKLTYQPFSFLGWPPFSDTNPTYLQAYLNDP